ncbi:hypothetical protein FHS18_002853 [Paenibacillus phyllosphaerae]|uniref:Uncharacterized protein n=1 Tax=Paenibacillus phyllosphaerae TaxID=274593 RepID=A0A7W5FN03_9BACL|nr:hypothetical protein [Paenibacillus phyllosphaerae]MBB3110786.1 hypothetical protein [Paenibacillus phyllosphaerae]
MYEITIDLYRDWINTVLEMFRGAGHPLQEDLEDDEIAKLYYMETLPEDIAEMQSAANEQRLHILQQTLLDNMETVIVPDIRNRTGYSGNEFRFRWVYQGGEHIVEELSQYRIPLGEQ